MRTAAEEKATVPRPTYLTLARQLLVLLVRAVRWEGGWGMGGPGATSVASPGQRKTKKTKNKKINERKQERGGKKAGPSRGAGIVFNEAGPSRS
jgi:hypothetical protein